MAGDVQVAGLRELMTERDINCKDDDLRRLLQHGYYNARLLGAATVERLVGLVGLKLGLACLLVKEFGASPPQGARAGAGARDAGRGQAAGVLECSGPVREMKGLCERHRRSVEGG